MSDLYAKKQMNTQMIMQEIKRKQLSLFYEHKIVCFKVQLGTPNLKKLQL